MIDVDDNREVIASIFSNMNNTPLVLSYLQGYIGKGWADRKMNPTCAQILVGDFSILAGDSTSENADLLVFNIPSQSKYPWLLIIPQHNGWSRLIEKHYPDRNYRMTRYAIKNDTKFSIDNLQVNIKNLNSKYELLRIDERLYNLCLKHPQLKDLCSHFLSPEDYVRHGLGFCIVHNGEVVCGASSYAVYDDGIELEIDTDERYRRQGLATVCASRLIIECINTGRYPRWDAATKVSLELAKKLGYEFSHEYVAYAIKMNC